MQPLEKNIWSYKASYCAPQKQELYCNYPDVLRIVHSASLHRLKSKQTQRSCYIQLN